MQALKQVNLQLLKAVSRGSPHISIGVIDGPVDLDHPAFYKSQIRTVKESQLVACKSADSISCIHGTFVVGMLSGKQGSQATAICPDCKIILRPIFNDSNTKADNVLFPSSTPLELADAIIETVDAGAKIINLSLGLSTSSLIQFPNLKEAYEYASQKGVVIVASAGNQGIIGYISIIDHPWIIPVAACDENNILHPTSNISPSIAKRGLMAPGVNIISTSPGGGYLQLSGTSFAAPFVTGTIALLWSIFKGAMPHEIVRSVRMTDINQLRHRMMFPPICNAEKSKEILENILYNRKQYV